MKNKGYLFCVVAAVVTAQTPQPDAQSLGSLEGQVVDAVSRAPLRKALLTLSRSTDQRGDRTAVVVAQSDAAGQFAFRDLLPGMYHLSGGRSGYISRGYGGRRPAYSTTLSLGPAQRLTGIELRLTPHAAISGRMTDSDGDPFPDVRIQLWKMSYDEGKKQLEALRDSVKTDDRGIYRLAGLTPGKYFLSASYREFAVFPEVPASVRTFYPGVSDAASAAPIDLAPGAELTGFDLRLAKVRGARITGRVRDVPAQVMLWKEGLCREDEPPFAPGKYFEFTGLPPGSYNLVVNASTDGHRWWVRRPIEVGTTNIEDLVITVPPAVWITGRLRVEGEKQPDFSKIRIGVEPAFPNMTAYSSPVPAAADGTFRIENLAADRYKLVVRGLPPGFFVKAVRAGGQDLPRQTLDLAGVTAVEIVLSPAAASIAGTARVADSDKPAPGATIVLIPQDLDRRQDFSAYPSVETDESGKFIIRNIVPGEYLAFAWEDIEPGQYFDPDFVRPVEAKGVRLTFEEGGSANLDLVAIPPTVLGDTGILACVARHSCPCSTSIFACVPPCL